MTENAAPFIPIWFDEVKLSPPAFRVLVHLWRRANSERACWPGVASIADACGIRKTDTVHKLLNEIEAAGLMVREARPGTSNLYRLVTPSKGIPCQTGHPTSQDNTHPAGQDTRCPAKRDTGIPRHTGHEGISLEGAPKEGAPMKELKEPQRIPRAAGHPVAFAGLETPVTIPPELDTPAFQYQWTAFLETRLKLPNIKPASVIQAERWLRNLVTWGHDEAVAALEEAVKWKHASPLTPERFLT